MLGVAVARAIHMRPEVVTNGLIFLLIAASLALTWRALRLSSLRERAGGAAAVWAAALLTILPMYDFGQREHLALVAMLPALAVYILRANRERVAPSAILIAGLCAATTMNFKPYFVFGVGFFSDHGSRQIQLAARPALLPAEVAQICNHFIDLLGRQRLLE